MLDTTINDARAVLSTTRAPTTARLVELLRLGDKLNAIAAVCAASLQAGGQIEADTGLSPETALRLQARRTGWDAAEVVRAGEILSRMPRLAECLRRGMVSWSQARAIVRELKGSSVAACAKIDAIVGEHAPRLATAEPEELVRRVEDALAQLRAEHELAREERAIASSFLVLQPRLSGGGSLYGEADTERFATLCQAIEDAAEPLDDEVPRARQRMDALVRVAESYLGGGSATRPRPRLIATAPLAELERLGMAHGARLVSSLIGRPQRLSPLATQILGCDSDVQLIAFDGPQPVAAGPVTHTVPARLRTAIVARDGGCRFPGCSAPASWSEVHHIIWRSAGGDHHPENLVLLCRRCHRKVHRDRWRISHRPDGAIAFTRRGKTYTTYPRARPALE